MVNAKLHIICGNCGSNEEFKCECDPSGADMGDSFAPTVSLTCQNCGTTHHLRSNDGRLQGQGEMMLTPKQKERIKGNREYLKHNFLQTLNRRDCLFLLDIITKLESGLKDKPKEEITEDEGTPL